MFVDVSKLEGCQTLVVEGETFYLLGQAIALARGNSQTYGNALARQLKDTSLIKMMKVPPTTRKRRCVTLQALRIIMQDIAPKVIKRKGKSV